ncbi:FtsX-like permease family protein [Candidatus Mycosynbacter amalyticus]|uniref:Cell division protein FtsX n=1 Tax=Candidatus Mycosynbacter amalyticus TaxID=2665156 RepID=A0A857MPF1_9BACT|nr:ABC transporter permease [Candidatus Mycosynbacter amalyticus]QHN42550.1 FtsX-like permease family protein [Candidatus Mycosynbacter amalyticus]
MSRGNNKSEAKLFALKKRRRRQWLTFVRMCRYGINNFSRNAWLTIAATAMMTLTLFVILMTLVSRNILLDSVAEIRNKVDMSVYVKSDTSEKDVDKLEASLENVEGVTKVTYVTPEEARTNYAEANKNNPRALDALNLADAQFPGTFRVNVVDINDTAALTEFTKNNELYKKVSDPDRPASFAGDKRDAIANIGRWVNFAEKMGLIISVILVTISSLIVFNTIRMAIFNRKEEIEMMKLIGADKGFIRGPFVVEAVVYGFIAALIATVLGLLALHFAAPKLESYGIAVSGTFDSLILYIGFVLPGMILAGGLIGVISSLFATRKYLKI